MAVTFVIGRAGSGKTRRCYDKIAGLLKENTLSPPIFLVVPNQATFQVERELLAEIGAFSRVRVVSFELLGLQIAAECGGVAIPQVTPIGRQMILGHLLRQHGERLEYFRGVARRPGVAAEIDATFSEFERSGKSTQDLADVLDQLRHADPTDAQGPSLQAKLRDIRFLYDQYTHYLGQERLDQHRRLAMVLEQVSHCDLLVGARVFVDDFYEFNDYERRLLAGLSGRCASVDVCLTLDPDCPILLDLKYRPPEMGLFHRTEETYRRLRVVLNDSLVEINPPVRLVSTPRFQSADLGAVERSAFESHARESNDGPSPLAVSQPGASVVLVESPNLRAEVDSAARGIRRLLREGFRLRQIAVLVRDLAPYERLIDISFREHGIRYFVDRRRTALHHPLLVFIRSIFQIGRFGWQTRPLMAMLKSGMAGMALDKADEFENYLIQHRVSAADWDLPDAWACQSRSTPDELEPLVAEHFEVNGIEGHRRRVSEHLRPMLELIRREQPAPLRDFAIELFRTLEKFDVRATLSEWIETARQAGKLEEAGEHDRVWGELIELFQQMVQLLGTESVRAGNFVDVMESGLDRFDLALAPPTLDQVLVGPVDRTRAPNVRVAFVLGLNDGQFPRPADRISILSHTDRRELRQRHVELDAGPDRRLLDEAFLGYLAFTRASERLVVSRSVSGVEGQTAEPSPYWQRLRERLGLNVSSGGQNESMVPALSERSESMGGIPTPGQLVTELMHWARERQELSADDPRPALYQWLVTSGMAMPGVQRLVQQAWPALSYDNHAALSGGLTLFETPLRASVRQLETFAQCPFRHFARYGLKLAGREEPGITGLDLSSLYHEVLERLSAALKREQLEWRTLEPAKAQSLIHEIAHAAARQLRDEVMLSTARNRYLLRRIESTLQRVTATVRESLSRGHFTPILWDVEFGDGKRLPALSISTRAGGEVRIVGQMDRVDVVDRAGPAPSAAAFSYRLSENDLSMQEVWYGISLQLVTNLLVLESSGNALAGRPLTPVASFYSRLTRLMKQVKHPDDAASPDHPDYALEPKPRGILHLKSLNQFDKDAGTGLSKVVNVQINKDGGLGCRGRSDAADVREFPGVMSHVRNQLADTADKVMRGTIDVEPYLIGTTSPCPRCEYRAICRFERGVNSYRVLNPLSRMDALERICRGD